RAFRPAPPFLRRLLSPQPREHFGGLPAHSRSAPSRRTTDPVQSSAQTSPQPTRASTPPLSNDALDSRQRHGALSPSTPVLHDSARQPDGIGDAVRALRAGASRAACFNSI